MVEFAPSEARYVTAAEIPPATAKLASPKTTFKASGPSPEVVGLGVGCPVGRAVGW